MEVISMIKSKKCKKFSSLKALRIKYDLQQKQMGPLLGVNPSSYSSKENGRSPFNYNEIMIIYDILNKCAARNGDKTLAFEDIFMDEKTPLNKEEEAAKDKHNLDESKEIYRKWFCAQTIELQKIEAARLLIDWYKE